MVLRFGSHAVAAGNLANLYTTIAGLELRHQFIENAAQMLADSALLMACRMLRNSRFCVAIHQGDLFLRNRYRCLRR